MKKELRQRFRSVLAKMSPEQIQAKSLEAASKLFECKEYNRAQVIMVFLSMPAEIETAPVVLRAWQDHKRVVAPKVSWEQRRMLPIEISSLTDDLAETKFGFHEPIAGVPIPVSIIDLVIVPGLGFDEYGNRLGRGRGFYDTFLANPEFKGIACAFAFEGQIIESVPVGPQDRPVHMLVTDERVVRFRNRSR
ncbi:MAG: 5-formyltetrahydrofolate cyclo-ligase [Planctomycetes bacterium]|nr:5-formyltetrahydrofolate cyclo-ligase [Planctomycetota bacterium]